MSVLLPVQVAVKFEHKTSKGCSSSGYPYEWTMYRDIRECYGIPKLHWKGVQGDFFVMVRILQSTRVCATEVAATLGSRWASLPGIPLQHRRHSLDLMRRI